MKLLSSFSNCAAIAALSFGFGQNAAKAAVNLVTNAGFESNFSGWAVSGNSSFLVLGGAHTGSVALSNQSYSSLGFLSQSLTTVIGDTYTLDFWLANSTTTQTPYVNIFNVSWNGVVISGLTLNNAAGFAYTNFTASGLVATSTSTLLQFGFRNDNSNWRLDDINVVSNGPNTTNTPDTGTSAVLLAVALTALVSARRRMR